MVWSLFVTNASLEIAPVTGKEQADFGRCPNLNVAPPFGAASASPAPAGPALNPRSGQHRREGCGEFACGLDRRRIFSGFGGGEGRKSLDRFLLIAYSVP
jgi:hypothetical protein